MGSDDAPSLKALAAFGPRFRAPDATFGSMMEGGGTGTVEDPKRLPFWQPSEMFEQFFQMTFEGGWIQPLVGWTKWWNTPEGEAFMSDRSAISSATADQLQKLLTVIVQSERWCEGTLGRNFADGTLLAIVERAEAILDCDVKSSQARL